MENINEIISKINTARAKYKPEKVKLLIVAEAPPEALERFFYYENVSTADYLFIGFIQVLIKDQDRKSENICKIIRKNKAEILKLLQKYGIFLIDWSDNPIFHFCDYDIFKRKLECENGIDKKNTNIILVKVNVFDFLYEKLKSDKYKVMPQRIPFPSSGHQSFFYKKMTDALKCSKFDTTNLNKEIKQLIFK